MKIEIDTNKIVEKIDVNKLVEDTIISNIIKSVNFDDIVENLFKDEETRECIDGKVLEIIDEYMNSEEGKAYIIAEFKDELSNSDILTDDSIVDVMAQFLRKSLIEGTSMAR